MVYFDLSGFATEFAFIMLGIERDENNSLLEIWYLYYPKGVEDYASGI